MNAIVRLHQGEYRSSPGSVSEFREGHEQWHDMQDVVMPRLLMQCSIKMDESPGSPLPHRAVGTDSTPNTCATMSL
ncbi:MAG: hypothetical protein IPK44_03390 [Candidatus Accumulibacter sp.]|uniref:hypothetical protein n=1 Tax=Accumulibacter sp. TaxID=2053492 RepID=UPI00338E60B5|nr:hypothetical protein [Accumulibacter sp.]